MPHKAHGTQPHCKETLLGCVLHHQALWTRRTCRHRYILAMVHSIGRPTSDMHPIEVGFDFRDAAAGRHGRRKGDNCSRNACMHAFTDMASLNVQTCMSL